MKLGWTKLVSGRQMAAIDYSTIHDYGFAGSELMDRAGSRVVEVIRSQWDGLEGLEIAVVCGKGNNGGDGLVIARLLHQVGVLVHVYAVTNTKPWKDDALHHYELLTAVGMEVKKIPERNFIDELSKCDIVVDCLIGTGLKGRARDEINDIIQAINDSGLPVVSVDIPSGVQADTGQIDGFSVQATITVTFGLPKIGQMFYPGRVRCGRLELVDIGFPKMIIESSEVETFLISKENVSALVPRREPEAHKGTCGSVLVVAGSVGMTGAAALVANAAMKSGAGRVITAVPRTLNDIVEAKLLEAMTFPLPEVRRRRCLSLRALGEIRKLVRRADVLAIGPGLGRHTETCDLVRRVLAETTIPAVVDADALNALANDSDLFREPSWRCLGSSEKNGNLTSRVLTPHIGEFCRLTGQTASDVSRDPISAVRKFARICASVVVLKGAPTCVGFPDGRIYVNPTGNPGMATAGSGDVLTGVIASLIAQGLSTEDAACCGVFLHGQSGDLACDRVGEWGLVAGDITNSLPEAILETVRNSVN
tara:strand:+ start:1882 stop:3489 length:1608 start_codon:yes stop_codon:yes gene_type:complete